MLLMPLRSDFGDINRVIGCTSGEGDLFAPPLAFAIEDVSVTPVEPGAGAEPKQAVPGFAEPAAEFAAPGRAEAAHASTATRTPPPGATPAARRSSGSSTASSRAAAARRRRVWKSLTGTGTLRKR